MLRIASFVNFVNKMKCLRAKIYRKGREVKKISKCIKMLLWIKGVVFGSVIKFCKIRRKLKKNQRTCLVAL